MNEDLKPVSMQPPLAQEVVSFENTEVAFSSKSDADLRRAYWLFKLLSSRLLMLSGKYATNAALQLRLPISGLIKSTIFQQFCGGETIAECAKTTQVLDRYGIGTILDYSVEGKHTRAEFEATLEELLRTVETSRNNEHIPFCVFKVSGLCQNSLLEKISERKALNADEVQAYERLHHRVDALCSRAADAGTPLFFDAEESWIQSAIDELAMEMMARYNKSRPVVYNTLQMYRHDRLAHLIESHSQARQSGYIYAIKLVRGAYMEKERQRAHDRGYVSPIQPDKASTDRDFNAALEFSLNHLEGMALCAGTHNEDSSLWLADEMDRRGLDRSDKRVYFAQLYGMSDHISFNLSKAGYNVAKYVPYGPVREVMPYLIRRAEENTSVAGQTSRELALIMRERKRRKRSAP